MLSIQSVGPIGYPIFYLGLSRT